MDIAEKDIGGARVARRVSRGAQALLAGQMLSAGEVCAIPIANRRALIRSGAIEVYPRGPVTSAGEHHIVHRGGGQYDVIDGVKLNDVPLSKDEAEELATRPD